MTVSLVLYPIAPRPSVQAESSNAGSVHVDGGAAVVAAKYDQYCRFGYTSVESGEPGDDTSVLVVKLRPVDSGLPSVGAPPAALGAAAANTHNTTASVRGTRQLVSASIAMSNRTASWRRHGHT